jgi:hypothetical protein
MSVLAFYSSSGFQLNNVNYNYTNSNVSSHLSLLTVIQTLALAKK